MDSPLHSEKKSRKRAHSTPASASSDVAAKKPPIPSKKPTPSSSTKTSKSLTSSVLNDLPESDLSETEEEIRPATNADNLFAWVVSPVKVDQFLRYFVFYVIFSYIFLFGETLLNVIVSQVV